jgi:two-component system sensor histidine kinase and response regulator WspE
LNDESVAVVLGSEILEHADCSVHGDLSVVVISDHTGRYGIVVDTIVGQKQLSVQALDHRLGKLQDISSAALLEDGSVVLVLDVDDLARSAEHIMSGERSHTVLQAKKNISTKRIKRILIVEDSLTVREIEREILSSYGYEVDTAIDGMDGWNAVRESEYDLVLTDIDMPRMDGIALVKAIKQDLHLKNIPVMIVSYKDRQDDRSRGLNAGADYYLTKGNFQDDTLIEAVLDLIGEPS